MSSSTSNRCSLIVRLQFSNEQANRIRQIASRSRNSAAESNQPACAAWTGKKIDDELRRVRSLLFDIEQDLWRRGQRLTGCVADHAQRQQRNAGHGTCLRDQFRLHINGVRAVVWSSLISLRNRIDNRSRGKEPANPRVLVAQGTFGPQK